jgi:hypothetical protein
MIDFRQRLLEHPAWLIMLPSMRVTTKRSRRHQRMQACLNVNTPRDPEVIRKLLEITSQCVVCGIEMHPLIAHAGQDDMSLDFTCSKQRCRDNKEMTAMLGLLRETLLFQILTPNQQFVF